MNVGSTGRALAIIRTQLHRALLRYGQLSAWSHRGLLVVWLICSGAILLTLWVWPAQDRIHRLETSLRTQEGELRSLDARIRKGQAITRALQADSTATSLLTPDPWPFLQRLTQTRSVHLIDYTPRTRNDKQDCQPLRLKINGPAIRAQGLLQDLLHSLHTVEHFILSADENGTTTLALKICMAGKEPLARTTTAFPSRSPTNLPTHPRPSAALFQPIPKVIRTRTVLEELPLASYRVIAVGRAEHDHYALVRTPAGKTHTLRPGARIGNRNGQVLSIHANGIEVQQDADRLTLLIGTPP